MEIHNRPENPLSSPPFFRVWMCGPFRVEWLAEERYEEVPLAVWKGRRSPRLLFKALLCSPRRQAQRAALATQLWPDLLPAYQMREFSLALRLLRAVLHSRGHDHLLISEKDSHCYRLEEQPLLWVDADAALALLDQGEHIGRTTKDGLSLLQQAALYFERGALLKGDEWSWIRKQRQSLAVTQYRCRFWLAEAYAQHEMFGQAQDMLHVLLQEDPGDEDVLRRLMMVLNQQRMPHQALKIFEEMQQRSHTPFSAAMLAYAESLKNT